MRKEPIVEMRAIIIAMLLIIALQLAILFGNMTGYAIYSDVVGLDISSDTNYTWTPASDGSLNSLGLTGSFSGDSFSVYLLDKLVYGYGLETNIPASTISSGSGEINLNFNYGNTLGYDDNNDGMTSLDGVVDFNVDATFDFDAYEDKVCTKYVIENNDDNSEEYLCFGSSDCCSFLNLESSGLWNDILYLNKGKYNAGSGNKVRAQLIYYDVNFTEFKTDIFNSDILELDANFADSVDFTDACVDTCLLTGYNSSSYNLEFVVDGNLKVDRIDYDVGENINNTNLSILEEPELGIMSSSVTNSPSSVINDVSYGTYAWPSPENAKVSDGVYTSIFPTCGYTPTNFLKATNFGFSIPDGATIQGIKLEVEWQQGMSMGFDHIASLVKSNGVIGSANRALGNIPPTSPAKTYIAYGGPSDLWGETWSSTDINSANFGAVFSVINECCGFYLDVDHMRITVYYSSESSDSSYPTFSNYWDNSATLVGSGIGLFNVTLANTNGTVLLEINNTNITATNLTANVYNVSYNFTQNGIYSYKWHSWGNGTSKLYNVSNTRIYRVGNEAYNASELRSPNLAINGATYGSYPWTSPVSVKASDGVYAFMTKNCGDYTPSNYLKTTDFGFSIPDGVVIDGIKLEVQWQQGMSMGLDNVARLVKSDGSIASANKAIGTIPPMTFQYMAYGGPTDLWGETWTSADINSANFGAVFSVINECCSFYLNVDHMRITVYYTEPALGPFPPNVTSVSLTTTDPATNDTNQNLTATVSASDTDGDNITLGYNWYKNNTLNATTLITNGLVSYWSFNNDTKDYFGDNDGTCTSCPTLNTSGGRVGGAYRFDGSPNYLNVGNSANLNFSKDTPFTISTWFKTNNSADQTVLSRINSGNNYMGYELNVRTTGIGGGIISNLWASDGVYGSGNSITLNDGKWHFAAMTYDGSSSDSGLKYYVDGGEVSSYNRWLSSISGSTDSNLDVKMGQRASGTEAGAAAFNGVLDEIQIYNRSLSASEIKSLYEGSRLGGNQLSDNLTTAGDVWKVGVTGLDYLATGSEVNSSNLTILSGTTSDTTKPTINFISPSPTEGQTISSGTNVNLNVSTYDDSNKTYSFFNDGLVGWWRMDGSFNDSFGRNNGSCTNCPAFNTSGMFNGTYTFDKVNDYISVPDSNGNLNLPGHSLTISLWAYKTASGHGTLIARRYPVNTADTWHLYGDIGDWGQGQVSFGFKDSTNTWYNPIPTTNTTIPLNKWTHLVVTYNGAFADYYLNGTLTDHIPENHDVRTLTNSIVTIGYTAPDSTDDGYWPGSIDEILIFNRSLSTAEIQALYNSSQYYLQRNLGVLSSGNYSYTVNAVDDSGNLNSSSRNFSVQDNIGNISVSINPSTNFSVNKSKLFNITMSVICSSGTCRNITAKLDPEQVMVAAPINPIQTNTESPAQSVEEIIAKEGEARVIVLLKDVSEKDKTKIKLSRGTKQQEILNTLRLKSKVKGTQNDYDFELKDKYDNINAFSGKIKASGLNKLRNDPNVLGIYVDRLDNIDMNTTVPVIHANQIWPMQINGNNITGKGQTVCIIDSGIDYSHDAFAGRIVDSYCYCSLRNGVNTYCCPNNLSQSTNATDDNRHGTHVAGTVASSNWMYMGVAPESNIVMIKVCNSTGTCASSDYIKAVDWCINNASKYNISVITMSIGGGKSTGYCDSDPGAIAFNNAVANGIFVSISAGNNGYSDGIGYPACGSNVTSVGATDDSDNLASFTNRDPYLSIFAPGVDVYSSYPCYMSGADCGISHSWVISMQGTSMATPHVAGAAALIKQYYKEKYNYNITPKEIRDKLTLGGAFIYDSASNKSYPRLDLRNTLIEKGIIPSYSNWNSVDPFYTIEANPSNASCLAQLNSGETCNITWQVNGTRSGKWEFYGIAEMSDQRKETSRFNVTVISILPNSTLFSITAGTTDFANVPNLATTTNFALANSAGKIQFPSNYVVNAEGQNYDNNVMIGDGFVSVNTSALSSTFNNSANITINDVTCPSVVYTGNGVYSSATGILSEKKVCTDCSIVSCNNVTPYSARGFDGNNDYITLSSSPAIGAGAFTITTWAKINDPNYGGIYSSVRAYGTPYNGIRISKELNGKFLCSCQNATAGGESVYTDGSLNDNVWHNIICARNSSTLMMYVDGILQSDKTASTSDCSTTNIPVIGPHWQELADGHYLAASIDEFLIFNRSLSASEVSAIYNSGGGKYTNLNNAPFNSGLVAGYHLDESSGSTFVDITGKNNGTCTNCPSVTAGKVAQNNLVFSVSHFTGYAGIGDANLTIWDQNDSMPYGNQNALVGNQIKFFANYTNNSNFISGASCSICFNDTGCSGMNENLSISLYDYNRSYSSTGNYTWNVTCNKTDYETLSASDNISIIGESLGNCSAVGGTITYSGGYKIHTFTSNGTFNVTSGCNVEVLVVAGGGGGGGCRAGGGGGGGGVLNNSIAVTSQEYSVAVGAGGLGGDCVSFYNGSNSSFAGLIAIGGSSGDRGSSSGAPAPSGGGSGGGAGSANFGKVGGAGTVGQGNKGGDNNGGSPYSTGGGGGAGTVGQNASSNIVSGNGGEGIVSSINGSSVYYAGGGGGGSPYGGGTRGLGGSGGGGNGGLDSENGYNAINGTGGGGGGQGGVSDGPIGGSGGSGIVIIRYLSSGNDAPNVTSVTLATTNPLTNDTNQNLTISSINASSPLGNNITFLYNWYKNNTRNATSLITEGLVAYYPLNNDTKDYWTNYDENNYGAIISSANGIIGGGAYFGGSQYLNGSALGLPSGNSDRTISFWVKPTATSGGGLFSYGNSTGTFMPYFGSSMNINYNEDTGTPIIFNQWNHLVFVYTGTTKNKSLYINGSIQWSAIESAGFNTGTGSGASLVLAGFDYGAGILGLATEYIDEFMIFNRSLNASEIKMLYEGSRLGGNKLSSDLTEINDVWKVGVVPYDYLSAGGEFNSSNVTILEGEEQLECGTISSLGTYNLTKNLTATGTCFNITADNVVIEGNGYTIIGNINASNSTGRAWTGLNLSDVIINGSVIAIGAENTGAEGFMGGAITATNSNITAIITTGGSDMGGYGTAGQAGSVTVINSSVITITATGGIGPAGGAGAGGAVSILNSNITKINATGGSGNGLGGLGGTVTITDSTIKTIVAMGGNDAGDWATAGQGGTVTITNSDITNLTASGGAGAHNGGIGGPVTVINSKIIIIKTIGGDGGPTNFGDGATGGTITITNSNITDLTASGGATGGNGGGDGGPVTLTNSTVSIITSVGGTGTAGNTGGDGGKVTITNSTISSTITTTGANGYFGGGKGGAVNITNSNATSINAIGGNGGTAGSGGDVILIGSNITTITANGGSGDVAGGAGGAVTITNSTLISIDTIGGATGGDSPAGTGGKVIVFNSNITTVTTNGGRTDCTTGGTCVPVNAGNVTLIDSIIINSTSFNLVGGECIVYSGECSSLQGTNGTLKLNQSSLKNNFGDIKFSYVSTTRTIFSSILSVGNNSAYVDSLNYIDYNISANVTLLNLPTFSKPEIKKDDVKCTDCYNFTSLNAGNVTFNVTSWSNYSIGEEEIINIPPNITSVELTTTNPLTNDTNQNLTISSISASDTEGDNITFAYNWYKEENSSSLTGAENLMAYYKLDENTDDVLVSDSSGNGYNGVASENTQNIHVPGKIDGAFNVTYDYPQAVTANGSWSQISSEGTISEWFYLNDIDQHFMFFHAPNVYCYRLGISQHVFVINSRLIESFDPTASTWHHLVVSWSDSGANTTVYIDGNVSYSGSSAMGSIGDGDFILGGQGLGGNSGAWDDVRVYNRSLSAEEVNAIYDGESLEHVPVKEATSLITNGLVAYYPLNNDTLDYFGGNDGINISTPVNNATNGKIGNGYGFDGVDDYIRSTNLNGVPIGNQPRTISAWINYYKGKDAGWQTDNIISWGSHGTMSHTLSNVFIINSNLAFAGNYADCIGTKNISEKEFHHISVTFDSSTLSLYVDGVFDTSCSFSLDTSDSSYLTIGVLNWGTSGFWNGSIDEVQIYNRSLSADEIKQLYEGSRLGGNVLDANLTEPNDVWKVGVVPYDYLSAGGEFNSSNVTILEAEEQLECGTLSSPGVYTLTKNLTASGTCFNITADNVVIDCKGFSITGNGTGYGINASRANDNAYTNLTMQNCTISNFTADVYAQGASGKIGGNVTIFNSAIDSVTVAGGNCTNCNGGNGGMVMLTNSIATIVNAYGGTATTGGSPGVHGGNGGSVTTSNSNVTTISTIGGEGGFFGFSGWLGGAGGPVIISNSSNVYSINATCGADGAPTADTITGGTITITNSNVTTIISMGSGSVGAGRGGGLATITNSTISSITTSGGTATCSGSCVAGKGGNQTIINSNILSAINANGGNEVGLLTTGGAGANVSLINSNISLSATINIAGGTGGSGNGTAGTLKLNQSGFYNTNGTIKFSYVLTNKTTISSILSVGNNSAYVNSTNYDDYNVSANITLDLTGWNFTDPTILKDDVPCPADQCHNFTALNASIVIFNVTSWSNYSIGEGPLECGTLSSPGTYILSKNLTAAGTCFNITADNVVINGNGFTITGDIDGQNLTYGGNGHLFNITDCNINGNILSMGYENIAGFQAGNGGFVTVINSNVSLINTTGGSSSGGLAGFGGDITLLNSNVNSSIIASASQTSAPLAGNGGDIIISGSNVQSIISRGGPSSFGPNGNGGDIIMNDSQVLDGSIIDLSKGFGSDGTLTLIQSGFYNSNGSIRFSYVSTKNTTISSILSVSNNSAYVNSTNYDDYNVSANVTLLNLPTFSKPEIKKDDVKCTDCYNFTSLNAGNVTFNVTSWSNYSIGEGDLECGTLNQTNTVYTLQNNITTNETCFNITADNITIDGMGYTINSSSGNGVYANGVRDITIRNLTIIKLNSAGNYGISFENTSNSLIDNVTTIDCYYGFHMYTNSNNNTIINSKSTGGNRCLYIRLGSNSNYASNNNFSCNFYSVYIFSSNYSSIISNYFSSDTGIQIFSYSNYNNIFGNTINSNKGINLFTGPPGPTNNIILNNIIYDGSGDEIIDSSGGPNYLIYNNSFGEIKWTDNNFLQNMDLQGALTFPGNITIGNNSAYFNPSAFTGLINSSANVTLYGIGNRGYLNPTILKDGVACGSACTNLTPLSNYASMIKFNVASWSNYSIGEGDLECGTISSPGTYTLTKNLTNSSDCLYIDSNDVILDGNGYSINCTGSFISGIRTTSGKTNVTIKNFKNISNCYYGIYLYGSSNDNIFNNTISNSNIGLHLDVTSSNNRLSNNTIVWSTYGIYIQMSSSNNLINNNTITNNNYGITTAYMSGTNTFLNNNIYSSGIREINSIMAAMPPNDENYLVYNNSFGEIRWTNNADPTGFLRNMTTKGALTFPGNITIGNNSAYLNTAGFIGSINSSARINLYNIGNRGFARPTILKDGVPCGSACYNFTPLNASTVIFNVTSWSNYSIGNNTAPNITAIILNTTNPLTNDTNQNLTAYIINATDADNDNITFAYNWYKNGTLNATTLITNGLVSYWSLNNDTYDYFGSNDAINNGAILNTSTGKVGGNYNFDGINDNISSTNNIGITGGANRTLAAWIKINKLPAASRIMGIADWGEGSSGPRNFGMLINGYQSNKLDCWYCDPTATNASSTILQIGTWYFVAATYDGVRVRTYVNGNQDGSTTSSNYNVNTLDGALWLGGLGVAPGPDRDYFNGSIDEVQIFNRTLNDSEIKMIYEGSRLGGNILSENLTKAGDVWKVGVKPADYLAFGNEVNSSNITILNTVPNITSVILNTTNPLTNDTNQNLTAYVVNATDADNDNITFAYNWYKNNNLNSTTLIQNGLVAYYPLNNDTLDYFGNNNGANVSTPINNATNGKIGNGYYFDGSNDYIEIPDNSTLQFTNNMSISVWVNQASGSGTTQDWVLGKWDETSNKRGYHISMYQGLLACWAGSGSGGQNVNIPTPVSFNTWHHVTCVYNAGNMSLYLDGVLNQSGLLTITSLNAASGVNVRIGGGGNYQYGGGTNRYFKGDIDEIQLFNRSLSSLEVKQLYDGSRLGGNVLDANMTSANDTWKVGVKPADYLAWGNEVNSSNLTILGRPGFEICGTLDQANTVYILENNIGSVGDPIIGTCFTIAADNVTLDGNGKTITGGEIGIEDGVYAESRKNITIKNLNIVDFWNGISMKYTNDSLILNNTAVSNGMEGVRLLSCSNNQIINNTFISQSSGVWVIDSSLNNLIEGNNATSNNFGVWFYPNYESGSPSGNILLNNILYSNSGGNIKDETTGGSTNYLVYNNPFGEISWTNQSFLSNMNVAGALTFPGNIKIGEGYAFVNASAFTSGMINSSANITLNNLIYNGSYPLILRKILRDNVECQDGCSNITAMSNQNITFTVPHW